MSTELEKILEQRRLLDFVELDDARYIHAALPTQIFRSGFVVFDGLIRYAKERLYHKSSRELDFAILNSSELNAFAYASKDSEPIPFDFIGVMGGSLFTIYDFYHRLFAHPANFPKVGAVSLEVAPEPTYFTDNVLSSTRRLVVPKCPIRRICADLFSQLAASYLFAHELAHLTNGHLELLRKYRGAGLLSEDDVYAKDEHMLFYQALEADADANAIYILMEITMRTEAWRSSNGASTSTEDAKASDALFGSFGKLIDTVMMTLYLFYRNYDAPWMYEKADEHTHPLPAIRMVGSLWHVYGYIARYSPTSCDHSVFARLADNVINIAEAAMARLVDKPVDDEMVKSITHTSLATAHVQKVREKWQSLVPEAEKYSRGGFHREGPAPQSAQAAISE